MKTIAIVTAFSGFISHVAGHGFITSPPPRQAGKAMASACGQQMFSQQSSDTYGNIQGQMQVASSDLDPEACNLWLCKGFQFDDNAANVQSFTAGQVVPITVDIRAPHTGTANVSIVKTSSNSVIGAPLISFDSYASNAAPIPDDQKDFDITIPNDIGDECSSPGDCVIQWFWDARSIDQTYEACIDFTVGGSGNTPPPVPSSSSPASSAVPSATAVPTPTSAVPDATSTVLPSFTASPTAAPTATPEPGNGDGDDALPETFTLETFIAWLRKQAGTSGTKKVRRDRLHARAF